METNEKGGGGSENEKEKKVGIRIKEEIRRSWKQEKERRRC